MLSTTSVALRSVASLAIAAMSLMRIVGLVGVSTYNMKEFTEEYETVSVVTGDGTRLRGTLLNEDSFTIQFLDTREQVHSFEKSSLKSWGKSRQSLMPAYDGKTLPEKDLNDILAFLVNRLQAQGGAQ